MNTLIKSRINEFLQNLSSDNFCKHHKLVDVILNDITLLNNENYDLGIYVYLYALNMYNIQFCSEEFLSELLNQFFLNLHINVSGVEQSLLVKLKIYFFNNDFKYKIDEANIINNHVDLIKTLRTTNSKFILETQNEVNCDLILKGNNQNNFIPAISKDGGFIMSSIDEYSLEFIKYTLDALHMTANIGCGYGLLERYALMLGATCKIICNDACQEHLDIIKKLTDNEFQDHLIFKCGYFPDHIQHEDNSLEVIGLFRVLHFMNPQNLRKTIKACNKKLKTNGYLILSAETPYLNNWKPFIPEYEDNIANLVEFPGYISNTDKYETEGFKNKLPKEMHFLDKDILTRELTNSGFEIIKCSTFSRSEDFPKEMLLNGSESIGAIARKIN